MEREADDAAVRALLELRRALDRTVADLGAAAERADDLIAQRRRGRSWFQIVSSEKPPLVIETVTGVLDELGDLGSRFRREEALALQREDISITRIAELFRVTRQRVSALLHTRPARDRART
jgi:hypothetical protein